MSKLVFALLNDNDQVEKYEEVDMTFVEEFNKQFEKAAIPDQDKKAIYEEELIDMSSFSVLNSMITLEKDDQLFAINREPLREKLRKLYGYESKENQVPAPGV